MCRSPERVNASRSRARASSSARGVVRAQHPGQGGLGVMGGHGDGVGEQLAFLVQQPGVRADLASWAAFHRHSVVSPIPNPAATAAEEAISVATSCTAASRRPTSPRSRTRTWPARTRTPPRRPHRPPGRPPGQSGWRRRAAAAAAAGAPDPPCHPPSTGPPSQWLSQGRWRITALRHAKSPAQKASPAQPDTSMSGVLGPPGDAAARRRPNPTHQLRAARNAVATAQRDQRSPLKSNGGREVLRPDGRGRRASAARRPGRRSRPLM
jgi:hypothetical protein